MLNSETGHNQLAAGLALGMVIGLSPFLSLQTFILFLIIFLFRVQLGAAFLAGAFFKFIGYLLDPVADSIGRVILESESARPTLTTLYNLPLVPLTRFNNSVVMGSGALAFILAIPLFFVFRSMIVKYRETILKRLKETKFIKAFAATSIYKWYLKYEQLYG